MADPDVIQLPERPPEYEVPESLLLMAAQGMRFAPNDLRELKAQTGRSLSELTGEDAEDADRFQTMAWLKLRRMGQKVPWSECGEIELDFDLEEQPDPTKPEPSTNSPGSAASGA